jgi:hypothetical protein
MNCSGCIQGSPCGLDVAWQEREYAQEVAVADVNLDTSLTMRENGSTGQVTVTASGIRCSLGLAEVGLKFLIVAAPPSLPNK